MSDELLAAADARPDSVRTHWDGCYADHDLCLIARLAARVRELEADLAIDTDTFNRLLAERDALREENERLRTLLVHIDAHYSGSLDHQPTYVRLVRAALAGEKP